MQTACHCSQQLGQPPSQPLRLTACQHGLHGLPARQSARPAVLRVRFSACAAAGCAVCCSARQGAPPLSEQPAAIAARQSASARPLSRSQHACSGGVPLPGAAGAGWECSAAGAHRVAQAQRPCHPAPSGRAAAATACRHDLAAGRLRAIAGAASRDQAPRQPRESIGHA